MDEIILSSIQKVGTIADANLLALESAMKSLEKKLLVDINIMTATQTVDVVLARAQIEAIMVNEGIYERIGTLLNDEYQAVLNEAVDMYVSLYPSQTFQFTGASLMKLDALKQLDFTQMSGVTRGLADEITRGIVQYQYGAFDRAALSDLITKSVTKSTAVLQTQFDTALSGFYQEAANELAIEAGFEKYRYMGPSDRRTRDFCQYVLSTNEPRTKDEIDALQSIQGQGLPVFQYGGGYNCRHVWVAVK